MSDAMIRDSYGVYESNGLTDEHKRIRENLSGTVDLDDPDLVRIVRLRLVSDPGWPLWDLSYCWGRMRDGSYVNVRLPEWQWSKRNLRGDLIEMGKRHRVYLKGLGVFEPDCISRLV